MKKLFTILTLVTMASVIFAEVDPRAMDKIDKIQKGKTSLDRPTAIRINAKSRDTGLWIEGSHFQRGTQVVDMVISTNIQASTMLLDGRKPLVSEDTTDGDMIQYGTNVLGANGLCTQTFTVTYLSLPVVLACYNEASGAATNVFPSTTATNSVVFTGAAGAGINWYSLGLRP